MQPREEALREASDELTKGIDINKEPISHHNAYIAKNKVLSIIKELK